MARLQPASCMPNWLRRTVHFAYEERFVWDIFMGQLTLVRFIRGDTVFALLARLLGGVMGYGNLVYRRANEHRSTLWPLRRNRLLYSLLSLY